MKVTYIDNDESYKSLYADLFEEANDVLNLSEEDKITNMASYFAHLNDLKRLGYKFMRLPVDEKPFIVDLDTRDITIPAAFKANGIGVEGDSMAEILYFIVDRYFDDLDLSVCLSEYNNISEDNNTSSYGECHIQWHNGVYSGLTPVKFCDITNNTIIFGWPIHESITAIDGSKGKAKLKFSVRFNYYKDPYSKEIVFSLHTKEAECEIHPNLFRLNNNVEIVPDQIDDEIAMRPSFSRIFDSTIGQRPTISKDLDPYTDIPEGEDGASLEVGVAFTKLDDEDVNLLYQWKKIETDYQDEIVGVASGEIIDDAVTNKYLATTPGKYYVSVGIEYKGVPRWTHSNTTTIVQPSIVELISIADRYPYVGESVTINSIIYNDARSRLNGVQTYSIFNNDSLVDEIEVSDKSTAITFTPENPGKYMINVKNTFNNNTFEQPMSLNFDVKSLPTKPEYSLVYDEELNSVTALLSGDIHTDIWYEWELPDGTRTAPKKDNNTCEVTKYGQYHCFAWHRPYYDPKMSADELKLIKPASDRGYATITIEDPNKI